MKTKLQIFTLILLFTQTALPQIITVKQDSTGDYTIIQDAINASSHGDTVLVYPGTYYENISFAGKNITVASLNLTTNDETHIRNTIIDGNQNGSCVLVNNDENDPIIHGFTIQKGSGTIISSVSVSYGGGIYIGTYQNLSIHNCIIRDNNVTGHGGGISCRGYSSVYLSGVTIYNNSANFTAGGIGIPFEATATFDENDLCNIYLNYASRGNDIFKSSQYPVHVAIDTFTVLNPDTYYISAIDDHGFENYNISYTIQHQKIIPVDTNLYVDPVNGNDNNTGLNPQEPLKTIAFAYTKLIVDSLKRNTIYLADGIYSDTSNGEKFPLNIRSFVNVEGESRTGTFLDGEYKTFLLKGNNEVSDYSFTKMTLRRGTFIDYDDHFTDRFALARLYAQGANVAFEKVLFTQGYCTGGYAIVSLSGGNNVRVTNCEFSNNKGDAALSMSVDDYDTSWVNNCIFHDNNPDMDDPEPDYRIGRAFSFSHGTAVVTNSLFYYNEWNSFIAPWPSTSYLVNCTFTGNSQLENHASIYLKSSTINMYNCIFYDEANDYPIALFHDATLPDSTRLEIYNSLIEEGEDAIYYNQSCNGWCTHHYDESNIDEDPIFLGKWEHPYQIANGSPCIDAGTLAKLPDFIELPEKDLAGNPRIVGDSIDMGAYEWNPTVGIDKYQYQPIQNEKPKLMSAAPNPFSYETNISAKWDFIGHVQIEVYNNSGLRVKVLKSGNSGGKGSIQTKWDGKDGNGNILHAGIYHVVMFWGGNEVDGIKVVKM
ncbi:MAG: hypothetical protein DRJ05_04475 [Bacteroidetes bacterium]|nr:MAG: hypothetical protein DRJ05_04475 [Bacteroidota bacterium]